MTQRWFKNVNHIASHHLKPNAGKGHHILADGKLLYLIQDEGQLARNERIQQENRLDVQQLKKSRLVAAVYMSERWLTNGQDEAITRCCEMPLPLQELQAHFQESEGNVSKTAKE